MAQADLQRLAVAGTHVVPDPERRLGGRGAYICDERCAHEAARPGVLARAFRRPVTVQSDFVESRVP